MGSLGSPLGDDRCPTELTRRSHEARCAVITRWYRSLRARSCRTGPVWCSWGESGAAARLVPLPSAGAHRCAGAQPGPSC